MSSTQGAPPHTMRHPCRYRPDDRPGFPILCPILPCDVGSTATQLFGFVENDAPRSLLRGAGEGEYNDR